MSKIPSKLIRYIFIAISCLTLLLVLLIQRQDYINKHQTKREVGLIPTSVMWQNREYFTTGKFIDKAGKKLDEKLNIYEIDSKNPNEEIAVSTLRYDIFVVAKTKN